MSGRGAYAFRAARGDGTLERGVLEAPSREAASALLASRGLFPLELRAREGVGRAGARLPAGDLALGLRALATLLGSGLPMGRALRTLEELAPPSWAEVLPSVRESVRQGRGLASALASAPAAVPPVVLGIIQAGEGGSGLAVAVERAAALTESGAAVRAAVRNALAYPVLLACAGTLSVALLVGFVIPRFAGILTELGHVLPASTRLVLASASAVRAAAIPLGVGAALSFLVWRRWVAREDGRRGWHRLLLGLPLVGPSRLAAAGARACAALAALLESGVPMGAALRHASVAAGDAAVAARLLAARERVVRGEALSRALEAERAVSAPVVRLARAGEESGRLAAMLGHAAGLEAARAEQGVRRAVRLLEPALIVGFGAVVALVAAALLQAVYGVRPVP